MPLSGDDARALAGLADFAGYVRRRTGDADLAQEVVQEALAKALAKADDLRDEGRLLPWFWRIVRNTMHDALARRGRTAALPEDLASAPAVEVQAVCRCLSGALADLPERQREAVRRIDLLGEEPEAAAADLGIDPGNLKVIRHRARAALRERLQMICRTCAEHGCLDCHCREPG